NLFFRRELKNLQNQIREGGSLSRAMRKIGVFDAPFVNSVAIGEGSGQLDKILDTFSRDYQKEIDRRIKRLVSLLEPFLILGVGLVVGFVVLAMHFPVFEMDFDF
ncbi:MAG: type II secretion system F family protein, partial [Candidatus Omnitrophota bacterium]